MSSILFKKSKSQDHSTFTRIIFTCTWRCDCQKNHFLLAVFSFFINPLIISDRTLFDLPWVVGSWPHCLQCCSLRATQGELWQCLHGLWHRQDAALSWNINAHSLKNTNFVNNWINHRYFFVFLLKCWKNNTSF